MWIVLGELKWVVTMMFFFPLVATSDISYEEPYQNTIQNPGLDPEVRIENHDDPLDEAHSRKKRFIYVNAYSPTDIGYLIVVPYSFALPTFNLQTSRRKRKSITLEKELLANLTADEIFPSDSYDEPAYGVELNKMSLYFSVLGIDEDICQQKIICLVFSAPEEYKPLIDLFSRKLTADHGPIAEKVSSRYYRYVRAMQEGVSGGEPGCNREFQRCPYSTKDRLNMPALYFWTFLTNMLRLDFKDDWHG